MATKKVVGPTTYILQKVILSKARSPGLVFTIRAQIPEVRSNYPGNKILSSVITRMTRIMFWK
jgi:hypothetical protein